MKTCLSLAILLHCAITVLCRSSGAPPEACATLVPQHGFNPINPADSPPPYYIVSSQLPILNGNYMYRAGETYDMKLMAIGTMFQGFLVQSQAPNASLIGSFDITPDQNLIRFLTCSSDGDSSITHRSSSSKIEVSFKWTAPTESDGVVMFRYTVVRAYSMFYANLNAADYKLNCSFDPTPIGNHSLTFRSPSGCDRSSCDYYVGLSPNPVDSAYLDVYLEGNAAGWIGIGFSLNTQMEEDDVLGCRVSSGSVAVVDTWNPAPRYAANQLDNTQNGLCVHSTSFTNGRISCSFSRTIAITDVGQDYNLNNSYYLLFGKRSEDQSTTAHLKFHGHNMVPLVTSQRYNPVTDVTHQNLCPFRTTPITEFPLIYRWPETCLLGSCDYLVGLGPNPVDSTYLDVYLEGAASSWLAIGFSNNTFMDNDDVLGCYVNSSSVSVADAWNPSPMRTPNIFDDSQDGLCVYSTSFSNGRISCRFSRTVDITDVNQDYYLNNMFYLLFAEKTTGSGTRSGGTGFSKHSMTPRISTNQVNPLQDSNARCPIQVTSIGSHKLIFGIPSGCDRSSCDYYVGLSPNPVDSTYFDVYLEGNASGWIAIGFSNNTQMEEDDVLGCRVSSGSVTVVDTWNPSPRHTRNELDNTQDGLCVQSASFTNGRISCMFSRTIAITDVGQDYNLNNSYYLLFGRRLAAQSGTNLGYHRTPTPEISEQRYNPVLDSNIQTCPQPPPNDRVFTFRRGTTGSGYYFAARVNPDNPNYVDMTLEADTTGWVGIGFSTDRLMGNDDVLACHRSPSSDMVAVVDTWNPNPRYTSNQLDPNQNGVCTHSTQFVNGRITCTFSRLIVGMQMDHNLNDSLFQLYATSSTRGVGSLARHDVTPGTTTEPVMLSIANETAVDNFPKRQLTKVHGIFMLIAWPLLAVTAIFFAAWMKPAIPVKWFQVHRALMIISLFTTALGLIFIFVANARNTAVSPGLINFACGTNTAHFIIGFIVFILQIVNPIIAIFRCKPNESNRWIFNIFHGTMFGFIAELFALINVGLGIALFESNGCGRARYTILWVYIVFVILLLIFQATQFVVFTISTLRSPPEKQRELAPSLLRYFFSSKQSVPEKADLEMIDKKDDDPPPPPPPKKPPSADAPIRWATFVIFAAGTVVLILVLAIMIAAD